MTTARALDLQTDPDPAPDFTLWQPLPRKEAVFAPFPEGLDQRLPAALQQRGIDSLYSNRPSR